MMVGSPDGHDGNIHPMHPAASPHQYNEPMMDDQHRMIFTAYQRSAFLRSELKDFFSNLTAEVFLEV